MIHEAVVPFASAQPVLFPGKFQGIFSRVRSRYAPLLEEARATLRALPVPSAVREFYTYGVLEHAQPSFMLLPLMYLIMAEHAGGITPRHRRYLPWYMLAMELVAVLDDTVDHTPFRSGRMTYPRRFGESSAASFSGFLMSTLFRKTAETEPVLLPLVADLFEQLCALQTWENHSRYPETSPEVLARWLQYHYDAVAPAIAQAFNGALTLHGLEPIPHEVCTRFGDLMQDVDDIVNFLEQREEEGENDDLKMGIVTQMLLATVRTDGSAREALEVLWRPYREMPLGSQEEFAVGLAHCHQRTRTEYQRMAELLQRQGLPVALRKVLADAEACVEATPAPLRPCMRDMVEAFVNRLHFFGLPSHLSTHRLD